MLKLSDSKMPFRMNFGLSGKMIVSSLKPETLSVKKKKKKPLIEALHE